MTSIVIPAHNEEAGITRLLSALHEGIAAGDLRVYVICNGCSDRTAAAAREVHNSISVIELTEPSKAKALKVGDGIAMEFPRFYIDADVLIDTASVRTLTAGLDSPGLLAVAPGRELDRSGVSWMARSYYDVWEQLPPVTQGLFGRGVIGVNEAGFARIRELPEAMSDDLAMSEAFTPTEKAVISQAQVRVFPARSWRSLINRRVRAIAGNRVLGESGILTPESRTSVRDIAHVVHQSPTMSGKVMVFGLTTVVVRVLVRYRARRGESALWLRDETSRRTVE